MGVKDPRCWTWTPPECPVRVPLSFRAEAAGVTVEVRVGQLEGGDGCARVVVSGVSFESVGGPDFASAGADAVSQLAERVQSDVAIGGVIRRIVGRKPLLASALGVVVRLLLREAEGDEERGVLRGLLSK